MKTLEEIWPLFALRISCGPLELHPVREDDFAGLVAVVEGGVHDPERMPFFFPWTDAPIDELRRNFVQYHWSKRADFHPDRWSLELAVVWKGELVGCQGIATKNYLVTKTGETGSWLGQRFHGQGIGTLMRQTFCAFLFDHLDAEEVTSAAFVDNPASLGVSRKVGYVANGEERAKRREHLAIHRRLVLTPDALVRSNDPIAVTGVAGVRQLIGLDPPPHESPASAVAPAV